MSNLSLGDRRSAFLTGGAVWLISFLTPASQSWGATLTLTSNSEDIWLLATPPTEVTTLPPSALSPEAIAEVMAVNTTEKEIFDSLAANSSSPLFNFSQSQLDSSQSNLSWQELADSFSQLRWDLDAESFQTEVPRLPQTTIADVYKDVYEFRATTGNEGQLGDDFFQFSNPFLPLNGGAAGSFWGARIAVGNLPRFGGPLSFVGSPSLVAAGPRRPVGAPAFKAPQASPWDAEIDVIFPSQPTTEVEDVETFLRTAYRTRVSDLLERIDKSLKTEVTVNFHLMPQPVFSNPYQPRASYSQYSQPRRPESAAIPQPLPGTPQPLN